LSVDMSVYLSVCVCVCLFVRNFDAKYLENYVMQGFVSNREPIGKCLWRVD